MTIVKQFTIIPIEACRYFNPKQLYLLAGLYINAYPQRESNYMTTDTTISQLSELTGVSTDYIKDSFIPRLKELEDKGYRVETIQQQREIRRNIYYLPNPPKNFRIISSAVSWMVWPSCHQNSRVRRNGRVDFSQRTTLHH